MTTFQVTKNTLEEHQKGGVVRPKEATDAVSSQQLLDKFPDDQEHAGGTAEREVVPAKAGHDAVCDNFMYLTIFQVIKSTLDEHLKGEVVPAQGGNRCCSSQVT